MAGEGDSYFLDGLEGFGFRLLHHPASVQLKGWRKRPSTHSPNASLRRALNRSVLTLNLKLIVLSGMLCEPVVISVGEEQGSSV